MRIEPELTFVDEAIGGDGAPKELSNFIKVRRAVEKRFVYATRVAHALALAITGKRNLLLWGPGGHGKSEMTQCGLEALGLWDDTFVQSFDGGMDESRLWGGLDLEALDTRKVMEFCTDRSFMKKRVAVFEEVFDAPRPVLLSLKDVLTRKIFMNGAQRVPLDTEVVIGCTNRDPREFSGDETAYKALLERFPLQLQVTWDAYDDGAYTKLYEKVLPPDLHHRQHFIRVLANLMSALSEPPYAVSPRTAVDAAFGVIANAPTMGRTATTAEDFLAILLVQGFENYTKDLNPQIRKAVDTYGVPFVLQEVRNGVARLEKQAKGRTDPDEIVELMTPARKLEERLKTVISQPWSSLHIRDLEVRLGKFLTSGSEGRR